MSHIIEKLIGHNIFITLIGGEEIYGTLQDADEVWLQVNYIEKKPTRKITNIINLCIVETIELDFEFDKKPEKNIQMTSLR